MNASLYERYLDLAAPGLREAAGAALIAFIDSFQSMAERREFVATFLAHHNPRQKVRHELLVRVLLPVLHEDYADGDAEAGYWLAVLTTRSTVEGKDATMLLEESFERAPVDRTRHTLVAELLRGLDYAFHEWPDIILFGPDETTESLLKDIQRTRALDLEGSHTSKFDSYGEALRIYQNRN